jgi:hypothetical protein
MAHHEQPLVYETTGRRFESRRARLLIQRSFLEREYRATDRRGSRTTQDRRGQSGAAHGGAIAALPRSAGFAASGAMSTCTVSVVAIG